MEKLSNYVSYCGLYCKLCSFIALIPKQAKALMETMRKGGWEYFGEYEFPEFKDFWKLLEKLSEFDKTVSGCRDSCGPPDCEIRRCAREHGVITCAFCPDFPCDLIREMDKKYPIIIKNLERQKEIGLEKWIEEQEKLAQAGHSYQEILKE